MPQAPRRSPDLARMLRDLVRLRASHGTGFIHLAHSFSLHVLSGGIAVGAHYATMYVLLAAGRDPLVASAIGFVVGATLKFMLAFFRVFAPTRGMRGAGVRFLIAVAIQALVNTGLLALLIDAGLGVWPAQLATTVSMTFVTYAAYRLWVFR